MDGLTGINIFHLKLNQIYIRVSFVLGWREHCFRCGSHFHTRRVKIHGMLIFVYRDPFKLELNFTKGTTFGRPVHKPCSHNESAT